MEKLRLHFFFFPLLFYFLVVTKIGLAGVDKVSLLPLHFSPIKRMIRFY